MSSPTCGTLQGTKRKLSILVGLLPILPHVRQANPAWQRPPAPPPPSVIHLQTQLQRNCSKVESRLANAPTLRAIRRVARRTSPAQLRHSAWSRRVSASLSAAHAPRPGPSQAPTKTPQPRHPAQARPAAADGNSSPVHPPPPTPHGPLARPPARAARAYAFRTRGRHGRNKHANARDAPVGRARGGGAGVRAREREKRGRQGAGPCTCGACRSGRRACAWTEPWCGERGTAGAAMEDLQAGRLPAPHPHAQHVALYGVVHVPAGAFVEV